MRHYILLKLLLANRPSSGLPTALLFRDELGYRFLGDWGDRQDNSSIEESILSHYLTGAGYSPEQISRATLLFTVIGSSLHLVILGRLLLMSFIAEATALWIANGGSPAIPSQRGCFIRRLRLTSHSHSTALGPGASIISIVLVTGERLAAMPR